MDILYLFLRAPCFSFSFGYLNIFKMFDLKSLSGGFKVCSSLEIISPVNGPYFLVSLHASYSLLKIGYFEYYNVVILEIKFFLLFRVCFP